MVTLHATLPFFSPMTMECKRKKVMPIYDDSFFLQPGMFPKSLRGYVERALARCKDDTQKAASQAYMKEVNHMILSYFFFSPFWVLHFFLPITVFNVD